MISQFNSSRDIAIANNNATTTFFQSESADSLSTRQTVTSTDSLCYDRDRDRGEDDKSHNSDMEDDFSWGFYEDEFETSTKIKAASQEVREAWLHASTSLFAKSKKGKNRRLKSSNSSTSSSSSSSSMCKDIANKSKVQKVLAMWINPNPEVSIKSFISDNDLSRVSLYEASMDMSCCVSGFRIVQLNSGECVEQFNCIFCYGSRTFSSWKSPKEFREFASIIKHIHSIDSDTINNNSNKNANSNIRHLHNINNTNANNNNNNINQQEQPPLFAETVHIWKLIETYEKWYRCLRAPYLIEKSIALGSFMQSVFTESPTPGLLICFVQNENFAVE